MTTNTEKQTLRHCHISVQILPLFAAFTRCLSSCSLPLHVIGLIGHLAGTCSRRHTCLHVADLQRNQTWAKAKFLKLACYRVQIHCNNRNNLR